MVRPRQEGAGQGAGGGEGIPGMHLMQGLAGQWDKDTGAAGLCPVQTG